MTMELEGMVRLVYALLRAHIEEMIRCREPSPDALCASFRSSAWILRLVQAGCLREDDLKWCLAAAQAKQGSRRKENVSILLAYKLSNSGTKDAAKRQRLLEQIGPGGLDLSALDGDALVGTYLNQEDLWALTGRVVKFTREEEKIKAAFDHIKLDLIKDEKLF